MTVPTSTQSGRIFISYSRSDTGIADLIYSALVSDQFDVTIDRRNLPYGEEWAKQIEQFVLESDLTVWLVSPASIASEFCHWELSLAASSHKKIIPVVIAPTDRSKLPQHLGKRHTLPAEGIFDLETDLARLEDAIRLDLPWIQYFTRLSARATEWSSSSRRTARLLRGDALKEAETWRLRDHPAGVAGPSGLVVEYLEASRRHRGAVKRRFAGVSCLIIATAAIGWTILEQQKLRAEMANQLRQQAESVAVARTIDREIDNGADPALSLAKALAVLPDPSRGRARPYVALAEGAALKAFKALRLEATMSGHTGEITRVAASPSYAYVASASTDKTARLWSVNEHTQLAVLEGHTGSVLDVLFSPDEKRLFTASEDGTIRVWSVPTGLLLRRLDGHTGPVTSLSLSPDGVNLLSASIDGTARVWSLADYSSIVLQHLPVGWSDAYVKRGVLSYRGINMQGQMVSILGSDNRPKRFGYLGLGVTDVAFSSDGKMIFTAGEDGRIVAWSPDGAEFYEIPIDNHPIFQVKIDFAHDRLIAATRTLGEIWSLSSRTRIANLSSDAFDLRATPDYPIIKLGLSSDGGLVYGFVSRRDGARWPYLWSANDGQFITRIDRDQTSVINDIDVAARGVMVLEGVGQIMTNNTIRDVRAKNQARVTTLSPDDQTTDPYIGHNEPVTSVRFAPDSRRFVSGDEKGDISLWTTVAPDVDSAVQLPTGADIVINVSAVGDDGRYAATINSYGDVDVWVTNGESPERHGLSLYPPELQIDKIVQGSPAEQGGLKLGDFVRQINGTIVSDMADLAKTTRANVGKPSDFVGERGQENLRLTITPVSGDPAEDGMTVSGAGWIGVTGHPVRTQKAAKILMSRDGHHLFTGDYGGSILIWDLDALTSAHGTYVPTQLGAHREAINGLSMSDDGTRLLTSSADAAAVWDWAASKLIQCVTPRPVRVDQPAPAPKDTPRANRIGISVSASHCTAAPRTIGPSDSVTGSTPRELTFRAAKLGHHGERFVVQYDNDVVDVFDRSEPFARRQIASGSSNEPRWAFGPDDESLCSVFAGNHRILCWRFMDPDGSSSIIQDNSIITALTISPTSGSLIFADGDYHVKKVDLKLGQTTLDVDFPNAPADSLYVPPDENRIYAAGYGHAKIYDFVSGEVLWTRDRFAPILKMAFSQSMNPMIVPDGAKGNAFSRDGRFLLAASRNMAFIYDVPTSSKALIDIFCASAYQIKVQSPQSATYHDKGGVCDDNKAGPGVEALPVSTLSFETILTAYRATVADIDAWFSSLLKSGWRSH